jgi:hypothetical protein
MCFAFGLHGIHYRRDYPINNHTLTTGLFGVLSDSAKLTNDGSRKQRIERRVIVRMQIFGYFKVQFVRRRNVGTGKHRHRREILQNRRSGRGIAALLAKEAIDASDKYIAPDLWMPICISTKRCGRMTTTPPTCCRDKPVEPGGNGEKFGKGPNEILQEIIDRS